MSLYLGVELLFVEFFSEAKRFLIISPYQLVCALLLRDNKKGGKRYKNIFMVDEIIKNASVSQKKIKKLCVFVPLCWINIRGNLWRFVVENNSWKIHGLFVVIICEKKKHAINKRLVHLNGRETSFFYYICTIDLGEQYN